MHIILYNILVYCERLKHQPPAAAAPVVRLDHQVPLRRVRILYYMLYYTIIVTCHAYYGTVLRQIIYTSNYLVCYILSIIQHNAE